MNPRPESRWRLSSAGNRLMWAALAALVAWLLLHTALVPLVLGVVVYLALTAVAAALRRS